MQHRRFSLFQNKLSYEGGIILDWFNIMKVENIDFDLRGDRGFGYFTLEPVGMFDFIQLAESDNKVLMDFFKEKIRIHPSKIYDYLKQRLGREPTDKEVIEWVKRTIMHEATHAAMKEEQFEMADQQTEYGAFTGQFPESTYLRIKQYLKHPATREELMDEKTARRLGLPMIGGTRGMFEKNSTRILREIITFVDSMTDEMKNKKEKEEGRELLTRLEVLARKAGKPHIREVDVQDIKVLIDRYGKKFEDVLIEMFKSIIGYPAGEADFSRERAKDFEKQATTVMSTTAGFESRPRYGKKKEEEEDGKRN